MGNRIFISYSHGDYYDFANNAIIGSPIYRILSALKQNDIEYWMDENINPGDKFAQNIGEAISDCDIFIFISSVLSNSSAWASGEIHTAIQMNKRIVPIKIDNSSYNKSYAIYLNPLDFIDYLKSPQNAIEELIAIANHNQDNIRIPHIVKQTLPQLTYSMGEESLSNKVFLLFSSLIVDNAIQQLLSIFDYYKQLGVKFTQNTQRIYNLLAHITSLVTQDVKRQKLIELSSTLESIIPYQKRINKFLTQLSLMVIYFWLDEAKAVIRLQNEIITSEFKKTWWEDNGADIISVAAFIGGAIGAFQGAGVSKSLSQGIMRAAPSVSKDNEEKLKRQMQLFKAFKQAIGSIEFYK